MALTDTLANIVDTTYGIQAQIPASEPTPPSVLIEYTNEDLKRVQRRRLIVVLVVVAVLTTLIIIVSKAKK